jgi:hypothetical protein
MKNFNDSMNTAIFTTKFVIVDKNDITSVYHFKEDGAWQFSSSDPILDYEQDAKIVGLGEIVQLDHTLLEIADLPPGFKAHRKSKKDKWIISEISE